PGGVGRQRRQGARRLSARPAPRGAEREPRRLSQGAAGFSGSGRSGPVRPLSAASASPRAGRETWVATTRHSPPRFSRTKVARAGAPATLKVAIAQATVPLVENATRTPVGSTLPALGKSASGLPSLP